MSDVDFLLKTIASLEKKIKNLTNELSSSKEKTVTTNKVVEKRKYSDIFIDSNKEVKKRKKNKNIVNELLAIFSRINSIEDIIDLENINNSDKLEYMENVKFKKLYNIIPALKKISKMIGMVDIKKQIVSHINYFIQGLNNEKEMLHTVITGPPGVGKTELGKIIGEIYLHLGLLNNDTFRIVSKKDLIAEYVGQTAPRTQKVIDSCEGGVLFIDEAYSLGSDFDGSGGSGYGQECIDVINQNLTERAGRFVCIIAGYADKIEKQFFSLNDGLKRRFPYTYNIIDYTGDDLYNIFKKKVVEDGWRLKDNIDVKLFEENKKYFVYYGGDIEKIWQYTKIHFSDRIAKSTIYINDIIKRVDCVDVNKAIEQLKKDSKVVEANVSKNYMYM